MPQSVNKIIHYQDAGKKYNRLEFNSEKQVSVKYVAGDFGSLVPKEMVLNFKIKKVYDEPLFNKSNNGIINESINGPTIIYLELRKGMAIKELFGPAKNITYDLFYGQEGLIYSFYSDMTNMLSLKIKVFKDINNIYQKLKANSDDLFFRQHFVKRTLETSELKFSERDIDSYPELMTVDQVASFFGKEKKTIQNWVSLGKLPFVEHKNIRRFKKSEILKLMMPNKKRKY